MTRFIDIAAILIAAILLAACNEDEQTVSGNSAGASMDTRPNIVFIVADDLGYSDLGVFGSEIPTPNIDALANDGMLLTNFHAGMTCSPTRSMFMSGTDNHLAGLGIMRQSANPAFRDQPGYETYLNFRVVSLADLLHDAGYHTYITGKWHLGSDPETVPLARGFERSFVTAIAAAHLGGLSWNGPGLATYYDDTQLRNVGDDFYSSKNYTERMIGFIERDRDDDRPFFALLAYTAPHWPLQAPAESIAKFKSWYDDGYEGLNQNRLKRMKELNFFPQGATGVAAIAGQPSWEDLSPEEQKIEARKMEIFAAMVSDLDTYVGTFVDYLKSIGKFDNTLIMFISDNGPEGSRFDLTILEDWVGVCCDNSYDNLGQGDSYVMYGPNWAHAGSAAFRGAKWTGFEGGTHVPAFVHFPALVPSGVRSDGFGMVMDIFPTFLEIAGTEHPGATYRGQAVLPVQGLSLLPMFSGQVSDVRGDDDYVGWELYGQRAIRQGDWKIVWDPTEEDATWHLFNVAADPSEQHDLAVHQPERLAAMAKLWDEYQRENNVILVN